MNPFTMVKGWVGEVFRSVLGLYNEHERIAAPLAFLGGVTYDTLTLTRIDRLFENVFILIYLLLLGFVIVLYGRSSRETGGKNYFVSYRRYFPPAIQFLMGGLLSVYTIFYFRSTTLSPSGLFVILLIGLLLANEFLTDRLLNIHLLILLYFFVWFSFCVFFVPVMIGSMGDWVFYGSSALSFVPAVGIVYFIYRPNWRENLGSILAHGVSVFGLGSLIVLLYSFNLIPPIPLSLEAGGMYYDVSRSNSTYHLTYDDPSFYEFWRTSASPVYWSPGETVYCFTSIFAPTDFETTVLHRWQRYNKSNSKWATTDTIEYPIEGGRRGGYRGYTFKGNVRPGTWRVTILTENRRILGRVQFEIVRKPEGLKLDYRTRDV